MMNHLSLFTGIGGIDLAAEWAGFETVGQCEWADYPTKVLEKHWPDVARWRDVREFTADKFREQTGIKEVTLLSGGFPCQPHSLAGKRQSSSDERDLWPEYRRIIGEIRPKWILAENVRGLLTSESGRFFRGILRDLSDLGFDVGWCTYPAVWVGAIHRRERVFIIAHADSSRRNRWSGDTIKHNEKNPKRGEGSNRHFKNLLESFNPDRWEAEPVVLRKNIRVPNGMDRLKCLGNAVVPQQVYPILKAIAEIGEP